MGKLQPYYLSYLKETKDNREVRSNHNYMNWINEKHREFQEKGNDKRSRDYHYCFLKWLNAIK